MSNSYRPLDQTALLQIVGGIAGLAIMIVLSLVSPSPSVGLLAPTVGAAVLLLKGIVRMRNPPIDFSDFD